MKIAVIVLTVTTMILLLAGAVRFHLDTRCRQLAWTRSFELKTNSLLTTSNSLDLSAIPACKISVLRRIEKVSWQHLPSPKQNLFNLTLRGKL